MSRTLIDWASEQRAGDPTAKAILLLLADHANSRTGECFPAVRTIAERLEVSERTVQRRLLKLEARQLISRRPDSRDDGGQTSNRFDFPTFEEERATACRQPVTPPPPTCHPPPPDTGVTPEEHETNHKKSARAREAAWSEDDPPPIEVLPNPDVRARAIELGSERYRRKWMELWQWRTEVRTSSPQRQLELLCAWLLGDPRWRCSPAAPDSVEAPSPPPPIGEDELGRVEARWRKAFGPESFDGELLAETRVRLEHGRIVLIAPDRRRAGALRPLLDELRSLTFRELGCSVPLEVVAEQAEPKVRPVHPLPPIRRSPQLIGGAGQIGAIAGRLLDRLPAREARA